MNAATAAPMRVFLVDDDVDTTESMRLLFKLWGHDVYVANDGAMAIERAPLLKPDLMMVDLGMPVVDGLQVARQLRPRPELSRMALVAVSGYADAPHRGRALDAGFDEYLVKPVHADEMTALIERVRARIAATKQRTDLSAEAVAASRAMKAKAMAWLDGPCPARLDAVPVRIEKSGISDLVSLADRATAERLRQWLSERACRLGPVFEPRPGQFAFFSYSRRQCRRLLIDHPEFRLEE